MPAGDNATLANFELPRIDHGERMLAFLYDRPSFFATGHPFTKVARISYRQLDQLPSPRRSVCSVTLDPTASFGHPKKSHSLRDTEAPRDR